MSDDVEMDIEGEEKGDILEEILKQGPAFTDLIDEFDGVLKKYKTDANILETRNEQFRDYVSSVFSDMDGDFVGEFLPQFVYLVEQLAESEYQLHISQETLKCIRKDYESEDTLEEYNIHEAFKNMRSKKVEETKELQKKVVKERRKKFIRQLRNNGIEWKREKVGVEGEEGNAVEEEKKQESEDDMEVMNNEKSYVCKISRKPFVDPCYFEQCGHRYEYNAIIALFQQKKSDKPLECPILGCKAKIDDISRLFKDEKTKYLTQKWLQEKKLKKNEKPVADFTRATDDDNGLEE